ncbi:MAG: outer membrane protein transport protein, partial [Kiritimatiellae bacterium]|nr:outer membrane protein transport protein [Kiritimatiellia bacterium]
MNLKKHSALLAAGLSAGCVWASGFGLYEASAKTYALGGAVMGRAVDASANFFNPATLVDLTNATFTAGFMTEHPRARMKTSMGGETANMNPGCFLLPHFHMAVPLPWDFTFGLGMMPEYGLGSEYSSGWDLDFNSTETTVQSVTLNPNLAYKATDRWSLGAGLRVLWFDFEQYSKPVAARASGTDYRFRNRLKGNNGMADYGFQVGTKYDLLDDLSVGVNYKSMTRVHVKGRSQNELITDGPAAAAMRAAAAKNSGGAATTLDLPQSITAGLNWDVADDWHLGCAVAWTDWSSVDVLNFHLPGQTKPIKLKWEDTWRFAVAPAWDFAEDWTAMASYVFETDCCGDQDSTMLPPSQRHMISCGLAWHALKNLEVALTYGIILMDGAESDCTKTVKDAAGNVVESTTYRYAAHRALSHAAG